MSPRRIPSHSSEAHRWASRVVNAGAKTRSQNTVKYNTMSFEHHKRLWACGRPIPCSLRWDFPIHIRCSGCFACSALRSRAPGGSCSSSPPRVRTPVHPPEPPRGSPTEPDGARRSHCHGDGRSPTEPAKKGVIRGITKTRRDVCSQTAPRRMLFPPLATWCRW